MLELEHLLKMIVKMVGKNQIKHIVLDSTELKILCTRIKIVEMMVNVQKTLVLTSRKLQGSSHLNTIFIM